MGRLTAEKAQVRFQQVVEMLERLLDAHPDKMTSAQINEFVDCSNGTMLEICDRMVKHNLVQEMAHVRGQLRSFVANPERLPEAFSDRRLVESLIWPNSASSPLRTDDEEDAQTSMPVEQSVEAPPPPPVNHQPPVAAEFRHQPPPYIPGVARPSPDASPSFIQDWIFTVLHAQTENLIYIRTRIDEQIAKIDTRIDEQATKIDRMAWIVEKLL